MYFQYTKSLLSLFVLLSALGTAAVAQTENSLPVAEAGDFSTLEDTVLNDSVTAIDEDGDALTYQLSSEPVGGALALQSSGSFTYTPDENWHGTDSFSYRVFDGEAYSNTATGTITVTPVNDKPIAYPVSFSVANDRKYNGYLFGYDGDEGQIPDNLDVVDSPDHGSLTLQADGAFEYIPEGNYIGADAFTFRNFDGELYSDDALVSIEVTPGTDADDIGVVGDTLLPSISAANLRTNTMTSKLSSLGSGVVDLAIDHARSRVYALTKTGLEVFSLEWGINEPELTAVDSVDITGEFICLAPDSRRAFIAEEGRVVEINLYPTGSTSSAGLHTAFSKRIVHSLPQADLGRIRGMALHPDGENLYLITQGDVPNKAGAGAVYPSYLLHLEVPESAFTNNEVLKFRSSLQIADDLHNVSDIAISPDGNYALITAEGSQIQQATPFGIRPVPDEQTGGIAVVELNRMQVVGDILPTSVKGEDTEKILKAVGDAGRNIIHPSVSYWDWRVDSAGTAAAALSGAGPFGASMSTGAMLEVANSLYILNLYMETYQDYGSMMAYANSYPTDMVAASGVDIGNLGKMGLVTMEDTNNIGVLQVAISEELGGFVAKSESGGDADVLTVGITGKEDIYFQAASLKTINGLGFNDNSPLDNSVLAWLHMNELSFTPGDDYALVGMTGGRSSGDQNNVFAAIDVPQVWDQISNLKFGEAIHPVMRRIEGGNVAPRQVATFSDWDTDGDGVSNHVEAFNRWNSYRGITVSGAQGVVSYPATSEFDQMISHPTIAQDSNCSTLYFLPHSGTGYRFNDFGNPSVLMNLGTWITVSAIEAVGRQWYTLFNDDEVDRPYFPVAFMATPDGPLLRNINDEPISAVERNGSQACFPYFKEGSDEAHDFLDSNSGNRTNNTGETDAGYDSDLTEKLVELLLASPTVLSIEIDPFPLSKMDASIQSDPRMIPKGVRDPNSTIIRDADAFMMVRFICGVAIDLDVDSDNNGGTITVERSPKEENIENPRALGIAFSDLSMPGKIVMANASDTDGDDVPDYADASWGSRDIGIAYPEADGIPETAPLVPVKLYFPDPMSQLPDGSPEPTIVFEYDLSDPNYPLDNARLNSDDPTQNKYPLAKEGKLRLWRSGSSDGSPKQPTIRSFDGLESGGDLVKPNVPYSLAQLRLGQSDLVTFYMEAVRHSTEIAGDMINVKVMLGDTQIGSDAVAFTVMDQDIIEVDIHGRREEVLNAKMSNPAPRILVTRCLIDLDSIPEEPDPSGIVYGDVELNMIVTSDVTDRFKDDWVEAIGVRVNSSDQADYILSASEVGPRTASGNFEVIHQSAENPEAAQFPTQTVFTGKLLDVPLYPGQNVLEFVAVEKVLAGKGTLTLSLPLYDSSSIIPDDESEEDSGDRVLYTTPYEILEASEPGEFYSYMFKLKGPSLLLENLNRTEFANLVPVDSTFPTAEFRVMHLEKENAYYLASPSANGDKPEGIIFAELNPYYRAEDVDVDRILEFIRGVNVGHAGANDLIQFKLGLQYGLYAGGATLVTDTFKAGLGAFHLVADPLAINFYHYTGNEDAAQQHLEAFDNAAAPVIAFSEGVEVLYDFCVQTNSENIEFWKTFYSGDTELRKELYDGRIDLYRYAGSMIATLSKEGAEAFGDADAAQRGYYIGRVTFVALEVLVPFSKAKQAKNTSELLTKMSDKDFYEAFIARLDDPDLVDLPPTVRTGVQNVAYAELAFHVATPSQCFVAGTLIHTDSGLVAIEEIEQGAHVLSRDPESGQMAYKPVLETFITHPERLYHITISSGGPDGDDDHFTLSSTGEHPFYSLDSEGFVLAGDLKVGELLLVADGRSASVSQIRIEDAPQGEHFTTYNFEVADYHTYFVGDTGIWVHNLSWQKCGDYIKLMAKEATARRLTDDEILDQTFELLLSAQRTLNTIDPKASGYAAAVTSQIILDNYAAGLISDLKYVHTFNDLKRFFRGTTQGGIEIHHIVEEYIQDLLGIPVNDLVDGARLANTVPAIAVPGRKGKLNAMNEGLADADKLKAIHRGRISDNEFEPDGISAVLQSRIKTGGNNTLSEQQIIEELCKIYMEKDEWSNMWPVARDWLKKMQVDGNLDGSYNIPKSYNPKTNEFEY